ncbi:MAG: type II toxin-antitoxin system Phd/YefM family antitoxin [Deferrisomatales bacterium]
MRFVTVRDFRVNPARLWRQVEEEDLVVTSNGRPIALLSPLDPDQVDETLALLHRLRAQMAVSRLRKVASDGPAGGLTDEDIEAEISAARRDR